MARKTKGELTTLSNSNFADNTSGAITPAKQRAFNGDLLDSLYSITDQSSGSFVQSAQNCTVVAEEVVRNADLVHFNIMFRISTVSPGIQTVLNLRPNLGMSNRIIALSVCAFDNPDTPTAFYQASAFLYNGIVRVAFSTVPYLPPSGTFFLLSGITVQGS